MGDKHNAEASSPVGRRAFLGLAPKLAGAALLGGLLAMGNDGCVSYGDYVYADYANYANYSNYSNYYNSAAASQSKGAEKITANPAD